MQRMNDACATHMNRGVQMFVFSNHVLYVIIVAEECPSLNYDMCIYVTA